MGESGSKKFLIAFLFAFLAIIAFGLVWFFFGAGAAAPVGFGWYLFSFAAGLSMIVLPCTLPLAFVIVPLSMGKGPAKGFLIAIAFGLGVAVTLSMYGVIAAIVGKVAIEGLGAPLETVKNWLYFVAGAFAYLFALGELGLVNFHMPSYSGAFPGFIQRQQDVFKALLLGLFLGNIGVGCPHPATPVIFTRIAVSGDVFYGWLLFFVHAIGRILPLLFLAILGIIGVNALNALVKHKEKISRATGWGMVFVAGFIIVLGLFTHDWWVLSGQHTLLEEITQEERFLGAISERLGAAAPHAHGGEELAGHTGLLGLPLAWGTWVLLFLWILPFFWHYKKKKKEVEAMSETPEKTTARRTLPYLFWNFVTLSLLLIAVFGYALPARFRHQTAAHAAEEMRMEGGMIPDGHNEAHGGALYHEEGEITEGLAVNFNITPVPVLAGTIARLDFFVNKKPGNVPVTDLEIEHEKFIHVIGARDDLNEFFHIHPEPRGVQGSPAPDVVLGHPQQTGYWSVPYVFKKPGTYKVWSDVRRGGETHSTGHLPFSVEGDGPRSEKSVEYLTNVIVGDYQVGFSGGERLVKEREADLVFEIRDVLGTPVEVEPYLAADMHLTIIKDDWGAYIHTHPESGDHLHSRAPGIVPLARANGGEHSHEPTEQISFHVTFPEEGIYKLFAQFRPKGIDLPPDEALTAEFYVEVAAAGPGLSLSPWWINLIWSAIAIVLLSWGVKRYITVPVMKKP
ncbi:MAG: hypothetical protein HY435_00195 [Candidatus Liptonbacteria bacterium]|nr:hypothetical protein [Candidatus Liptonbacteria bacterium]